MFLAGSMRTPLTWGEPMTQVMTWNYGKDDPIMDRTL